ncbi:DUF4169 family protein [Gemmobacter nectariphilus]|uniref:DUF4169 family protein n=1 Tax=Gemmobacter nectariphilus TaxID=220343 RepID=UPI0004140B09|nr:DUF4169 family protein [Gemmobacter nectariphilus]
MAEIVNLRTAKKQAARKAARAQGDANAAKFGRSKAEKDLARARSDKAERDLDAHKRETD